VTCPDGSAIYPFALFFGLMVVNKAYIWLVHGVAVWTWGHWKESLRLSAFRRDVDEPIWMWETRLITVFLVFGVIALMDHLCPGFIGSTIEAFRRYDAS
jgi:hypothetical protein